MNAAALRNEAETKLCENPEILEKALRELTDWVKSQKHISGCRTDNSFLLRFLRMKKFEMADTIKVLEKYMKMRCQNPEWFANLNIAEPKLNQLISDGYCFVLPECDAKGCKVVYSRAASMDASLYNANDVMRAHLLTFEALLEDEDVQVNGVTYVFDESDVNWSHIRLLETIRLNIAQRLDVNLFNKGGLAKSIRPDVVLKYRALLTGLAARLNSCLRTWCPEFARHHTRSRDSLKLGLSLGLLNKGLF